MKIAIVLFLEEGISDDDLYLGESFVPQMLAEKLSSIEEIENVYFSVPGSYNGEIVSQGNVLVREKNDDVEFWKELFEKSDADHLVKIFADSFFVDVNIIAEMLAAHTEYLAEFTYSDNLPAGLGCEIFSKELIKELPDFEEQTLPLSSIIKANINQFDIELFYKDPDIRDKRISFRGSDQRDAEIMKRLFILNNNEAPEYGSLKQLIEGNPEVLFIGPAYLELELNGACDLDCIFCYRGKITRQHPEMSPEMFKTIVQGMQTYKLPYTLCFGGSGEPLMNSAFYQILEFASQQQLVKNIVIETNGIYLNSNFLNAMENIDASKVILIININGIDRGSYQALHGADHFETVLGNIQEAQKSELFADRMYLQIMKINETEAFLDKYYNFWESYSIPIILQKQNTYLGFIEDRRYSDLTPLDRVPCWHLQRDLYVLADGSVTFCKQDVDGKHALGKVTELSLPEIWNKQREHFLSDYNKKYPVDPACKSCDEWYTYNF